MATLLGATAAGISFGVLALSGLAHLTAPTAFIGVLERQLKRASGLASGIAVAVIVLELGLGIGGLAALAGGRMSEHGSLFLICCAALYSFFAIYSAGLIRNSRSVPCGCSTTEHPVTRWVVVRAAVLSGLAVLAANSIAVMESATLLEVTFVALASVTFSVLLWYFPAALHDPSPEEAAA